MKKLFLALGIVFSLCFMPCFTQVSLAKEKIEVQTPDDGVYIFKINTKKYGNKIKPYITHILKTPKKVYDDNCFELVVNGGFFDVQNAKSVSYVIIDKELKTKVESHKELVENLKKENRLEKVLSRSEFRILENKKNNKLKFDIAYHTDSPPKDYIIKHSLQAGPMLYPCMDLVNEGFVIYDENGNIKLQSVDILKRRERTALALKGKYLYIILFTKDYKVDANEMRDYIKEKIKPDKAMALDGGLSTAINYKDISIGSLGKYQRRVKSFLIIEK